MARRKIKYSKKSRSLSKIFRKKGIVSSAPKFILKLLPFILAVVLAGIGLRAVFSFFLNSDYFKIKAVRVKGEEPDSRLEPVRIGLSSKKGDNIFKVDLKEVETDIRGKYPELKEVKARRVLPDILEASYKRRKPFCQVDSGYFYLVSDDMVVFSKPLVAAEPDLTIITGVNVSKGFLGPDRRSNSKALKRAISLLKEIKESDFSKRHRVARINIYDPQSPSIYIEDGTRIEIGESNFKEREKVLEEVLDNLESKNKRAKIIDLRFKDVVVIPR